MAKKTRKKKPRTDIEVMCRLMDKHGLSQNQMARDLGVDPATINRLVQQRDSAEKEGKNILSRYIISLCAAHFDLPVKEFFPELKR